MAYRRQYARSTFLWTAPQIVHSRRHASQLSHESGNEEKPRANDADTKANVVTASTRKTRRFLGSDQLRTRYLDLRAAEDYSKGISKYQVLFNHSGIWFCDKEGEGLIDSRRNVLLNLWLRDNCRCPKCVIPETMQKSFNVFATNVKATPTEVKMEETGLRVTWAPDNHESFYSWSFLEYYLHNDTRKRTVNRHMWGAEIKENPPTVGFAEAMNSESGMAKMTDLILRFGFVFVEDAPFDDAVHTKQLLERIGPIRETHYGGFYDFVPDMAKADTAYSTMALPAHTDTTYFTDPAGLQAFHLLSHTPSPDAPEATGGESLLVDGFRAAEILRVESKPDFQELTRTGLPWHASGNKGITITTEQLHPVLRLENIRNINSPVEKIRWNNDDRGVLPVKNTPNETKVWYKAASKWDEILRRNDSEYWFQLKPGRILIFNNHRVLHGRSAFTGLRRICGGYINMDDFMSRWRNSNLPREEVLAQVIG